MSQSDLPVPSEDGEEGGGEASDEAEEPQEQLYRLTVDTATQAVPELTTLSTQTIRYAPKAAATMWAPRELKEKVPDDTLAEALKACLPRYSPTSEPYLTTHTLTTMVLFLLVTGWSLHL